RCGSACRECNGALMPAPRETVEGVLERRGEHRQLSISTATHVPGRPGATGSFRCGIDRQNQCSGLTKDGGETDQTSLPRASFVVRTDFVDRRAFVQRG